MMHLLTTVGEVVTPKRKRKQTNFVICDLHTALEKERTT